MHQDLEKLVASGRLEKAIAEKLDAFPPGTYCFHKSWGVGKVSAWDALATKVEIDFEGKPGHTMGMAFAAGALEPVPDDHILARRYSDLEGMKKLAVDDPVGLVKLALESSGGSLSMDAFDAMVKGSIVSEGRYKSWWESTKKALRNQPQFHVPAKRNEPIALRSEHLDPAQALIEVFLAARDLKEKVRRLEGIVKDFGVFNNPVEDLAPVVAEINESARKATKLHFQQSIELLLSRGDLFAKEPKLADSHNDLHAHDVIAANPDRLLELMQSVSVTRLRQILELFPMAYGENWSTEMLNFIPLSTLRNIGEISSHLVEKDHADLVVGYFETGLARRQLHSDALAWICRERKGVAEVLFEPGISLTLMSVLENEMMADQGVRAANRLRDLLNDDVNLIPDLIRDADLNLARNFTKQMMMSSIFEEITRKALLARVVKTRPEVLDLVTGVAKAEEETLIVSEQSLAKRKADYDNLVRVQIPQNREDIKIARSYGDLRENFEYKSAKEQQRVLMRRQSEMERELRQAHPTNFENPDISKVSIGTVLLLENLKTGEKLTYTILGAWDGDPDNNVLAYLSEVGNDLLNKPIGGTAEIPDGPMTKATCKILEIKPFVKA
ncbi:MAG: GreA/GreB family elongation factor [Verrucomicrobiales bacterium]|nr:GreA/GreB family elongation factor [Verrucomicrobiales bacterium]